MDPAYAVGVPVQLHQQAAVALDQLRQRHLAPLEALSLARVQAITGSTSAPLGPPPRATIAHLRAIIHRAAATVPFHDVPEHRVFGQLEAPQLAVVTDLINGILSGSPVPQAHSADFVTLSQKAATRPHPPRQPAHESGHGVEAHGRPAQRPLPAPPAGERHRASPPVRPVPPVLLRGAPLRPPRRVVGLPEAAPRDVGPVTRCPPRVRLHQPQH